MKYNFMVTEYLRRSVRVEAASEEEAYQKVVDLVSMDKVLLTDADFADRDIESLSDYTGGYEDTNDEDYEVDDDFSNERHPYAQ